MQHCIQSFKRKRGRSERWRRSSVGCERVQALAGEKRAKMFCLTEIPRRVTVRGIHMTHEALHSESKAAKAFQGPFKTKDEAFKGL